MSLACDRCINFGLGFHAEYIQPDEYIEGNPNADIWIIGLNPHNEIGHVLEHSKEDLLAFDPNKHSYFRDFKIVSSRLFDNWSSGQSIVAHTDLVKCSSNTFPPEIKVEGLSKSKVKQRIISNCSSHLKTQISMGKPKLIICNGSDVCSSMLLYFPPIDNVDYKSLASYRTITMIDDVEHELWIVLSGFIGRVDDRNKRRLGKEIEEIIKQLGLEL